MTAWRYHLRTFRFNSLFEMHRLLLPRPEGLHLVKVSILYLRCTHPQRDIVSRLERVSILYLRCTPRLGSKQRVERRDDVSILYLRCRRPRRRLQLPPSPCFNSLFEMLTTAQTKETPTAYSFNSPFEMLRQAARRIEPAVRAVVSILYLRCAGGLATEHPAARGVSILYLRCSILSMFFVLRTATVFQFSI